MTDERQNDRADSHAKATGGDKDVLATLLTLAGPNVQIDDEIKDRVYGNVRKQWRRSGSRSGLIRWALPVAVAAGVLLALIVGEPVTEFDARPVGSIVRVTGSTADTAFLVGENVRVGEVLDTLGGEGLGIRLKGETSLRLDSNSLLKIDAADEFTLVSGQVYVDTGSSSYAKQHLTVHTASGSAVDIGTQFSVTFKDADMSVAVREGRVDVSDSIETHKVSAGGKLVVRPGTPAKFDSVPIVGASWDWAVTLAPAFDIEGRSLLDFLKWASRESGYELDFANDEQRMAAMQTRLSGPVEEGVRIEEAIEDVFKTTQFEYTIVGHVLFVRR